MRMFQGARDLNTEWPWQGGRLVELRGINVRHADRSGKNVYFVDAVVLGPVQC